MHYNIVNQTSQTLAARLSDLSTRVKNLAEIAVADLNVRGMGSVVLYGDAASSVYDKAPGVEYLGEEYVDDKGETSLIPGRLVGAVTRAMWTIAMGKFPGHNETQVITVNEKMMDILMEVPSENVRANAGMLACWDVHKNRLGDVIGRCHTPIFADIEGTQGMSKDIGYRVCVGGFYGLPPFHTITLMVRDTQAVGSVMFEVGGMLVKAPTDPNVEAFGVCVPYHKMDEVVIHVKGVASLNMFFKATYDPPIANVGGEVGTPDKPCMMSSLARHGDPDVSSKIPGVPVLRATVAGPANIRFKFEDTMAVVYGNVVIVSMSPMSFSWVVPGGKARTYMYLQYRGVDKDSEDVDALGDALTTWLYGRGITAEQTQLVMGSAPVRNFEVHTRDGPTRASYTSSCVGAYWPKHPSNGPYARSREDVDGVPGWGGVGLPIDQHEDVFPFFVPPKGKL